jgi:hypothetical protein
LRYIGMNSGRLGVFGFIAAAGWAGGKFGLQVVTLCREFSNEFCLLCQLRVQVST